MFENSPTSSINASKGQLYPAIKRLKARSMLVAVPVAGDARGTEELSVSELGVTAIRNWVNAIDVSQVVIDDPLRTRVLSFDLLSKEEKLVWISKAKELVQRKRQVVESFNNRVDLPFKTFAYRNAVRTLEAKMETLDELLYEVASATD